jgi:uncharacterized Zn-binding protein involved in type VI secretion
VREWSENDGCCCTPCNREAKILVGIRNVYIKHNKNKEAAVAGSSTNEGTNIEFMSSSFLLELSFVYIYLFLK